MVIQSRNPVHSVLFLILVFLNSAGLLLLLGLDFFAMLFLVVYVGAIAVLFLFVVMMLNVKSAEISEKRLRYLPVGGLLGLLFLVEILSIVDNDLIVERSSLPPLFTGSGQSSTITSSLDSVDRTAQVIQWYQLVNPSSNIESIGMVLYTYYLFLFLLASLILLVAMIGAILLTMHKTVSTKRQKVFLQNSREFAKTVYKIA